MITKIIFFRYLPLTHKVYSDFYMQELKNAGFCVEYWYLPFVIEVPKGIEYFEHNCIKVIPSYKDLDKNLKLEDREKTLFISIQTYNADVIRLFWIMTKNQCKLSVFGRNMIPINPISNTSKLERLKFNNLFRGISNKVAYYLKQWGIIKSYDVLFLSAETGINAYGYSTKREREFSKHILVNGDDYDRALSIKNGKRIIDEDYIVFIDQCLPLHPDIGICKIQAMNAGIYYNDLNMFFDKVELETGLKIVVAAHPKSLIYKQKDYFGGRRVVFGKTAELVRDSNLVLFHDSTSVGYAVFFEKPVISLVSKAIEEGQKSSFHNILSFSKALNSRLIYIDDYCLNKRECFLNNLYVDKSAYARYKYRYLTNPETEDTYSLQLVISGIKSL